MAKQFQIRQGTATEIANFIGASGELSYDETNKTIIVHDGVTKGGFTLITLSGGLVPSAKLPTASTGQKGIVQLSDTVTSTSVTEALTANIGKYLNGRIDLSFGIGQIPTNVTGSRAKGVTYTNNTGRPILVSVVCSNSDGDSGSSLYVNGVLVSKWRPDYGTRGASTLTGVVPNGGNYSLTSGGGIEYWMEQR